MKKSSEPTLTGICTIAVLALVAGGLLIYANDMGKYAHCWADTDGLSTSLPQHVEARLGVKSLDYVTNVMVAQLPEGVNGVRRNVSAFSGERLVVFLGGKGYVSATAIIHDGVIVERVGDVDDALALSAAGMIPRLYQAEFRNARYQS